MSNAFASREVCDLVIVDFATGAPILNCDYANTSTTEITGETVFAYGGKGHPRRIPFSGEKAGTFTIETQLATMQLYSLITGGAIETSANFIKREVITASGTTSLTVSGTPLDNSVYVYAADDDCGTAVGSALSASDKTVTVTVVSGTAYAVYYLEALSDVQKINIKSTVFPKACKIYADTYMKDESENILPYKYIVYKALPQSNVTFSQTNNGDPVSLTVTFDIMADGDGNMIDLILEEE